MGQKVNYSLFADILISRGHNDAAQGACHGQDAQQTEHLGSMIIGLRDISNWLESIDSKRKNLIKIVLLMICNANRYVAPRPEGIDRLSAVELNCL